MILLHHFLNFLVFLRDQLIILSLLILHLVLSFLKLVNAIVDPFGLGTGCAKQLLLQLIDLLIDKNICLIVLSGEFGLSFDLFLFNFFDFGMQVILLLEKLGLLLESSVQELAEGIEIVGLVNQEEEDFDLLLVGYRPGIVLSAHGTDPVEQLIEGRVLIELSIVLEVESLVCMHDQEPHELCPNHLFILVEFHDGVDQERVLLVVRWGEGLGCFLILDASQANIWRGCLVGSRVIATLIDIVQLVDNG